jgi:hypothetical protein
MATPTTTLHVTVSAVPRSLRLGLGITVQSKASNGATRNGIEKPRRSAAYSATR